MSDPSSDDSTSSPAPAAPNVLSYAGGRAERAGRVRIASYPTVTEADICAAQLSAEGIRCRIFNASVSGLGGPYAAFTAVEIHVWREDAPSAVELLAQAASDEWEPGPEPPDAPPLLDERGVEVRLVVVAAFENVRALREAQTVLAAARVASHLPPLVPRGDGPAGEGKRFVLKVRDEDLERAGAVLAAADAEAGEGEGARCPRCRSWRVYPVGTFWQSLAAFVGLAAKPEAETDCLACRYRGPTEEFGRDY